MDSVTIRDLRTRSRQVLGRVTQGESLTVTLDGRPVAELWPITPRALPATQLLEQWRHLPAMSPDALRLDLDRLLD